MDAQSERPSKRFKHQSYRASLKAVHLPSTTAPSALDNELNDTECHFNHALDHWRQLDLSPTFIEYADKVYPLSSNVALLLHHSKDVVGFWLEASTKASDDTLKTLFDLLQKLLHDLRDTLRPYYTLLLNALLAPLPKSPSADTLSTLLATLSSLFKNLLKTTIPDIEETWHLLTIAMDKCNPEIQRALAEVWALVLRRVKGDTRKQVLQIILRDLPVLRDTITWIFVYAFQSVARTLHTCTPSLFEDLLSLHISNEERTHSEIFIKRVITSLTHHCENADQFSPFANVLISRYLSCSDEDQLSVVPALAALFSVRKGSRLTEKQISNVLLHTVDQQFPPEHLPEVLSLGAACLMAGDMSVWMGAGRRFIEYSWEHPTFGLKLSETLSTLDWGAWNMIQLPLTCKHTLRLIDTQPIPTLSLLSTLSKAGRLNDCSDSFISHLSTIILKRLESWNIREGSADEITHILDICRILPSTKSAIIRVAHQVLEFGLANSSENNDTFISDTFGTCLQVLGKIIDSEPLDRLEVTQWCLSALGKWPTSLRVLQGLTSISKRHGITPLIPIENIYPMLKENILSHIHPLRLASLELLASSIVDKGRATEMVIQCLLGEGASLGVAGVRERSVRITGLPRIVNASDELSIDLSTRWLIAQFKVNLRPVWSPAIKALVEMTEKSGERVWTSVFLQLEGVVSGAICSINPQIKPENDPQETSELERTWRDPSALKLNTVVGCALGIQRQTPDYEERFDATNFETHLLAVLGETSSLTERRNADVIRVFLTFGSPELSTKPPRSKLKNWLNLFSKLVNPKAFHRTGTLRLLYLNLLAHPDRELQKLSLTCLLNYKSPHLLHYADSFQASLDDTRLREQLTTFDPNTIEQHHREEAVDVFIRLFFGRMLDRHGRGSLNKRASLLDAIGRCRDEEFKVLINLMLEPFSIDVEGPPTEPNGKQEVGFLNLLRDVLKRLGSRIVSYWPSLITIIIRLVANAQTKLTTPNAPSEKDVKDLQEDEMDIEDMDDEQPKTSFRIYRNIRLLGVRCFTDFFRCNVQYDFTPILPSAFEAIVQPRLAMFERENIQSSSSILELFFVWSTQREFVGFLTLYDKPILPKIYACLRATNVKPVVINRIFDIIEHIIQFAEEDVNIADTVLKPHMYALMDSLLIQLPENAAGELLKRQIFILSRIAQFVSNEEQAKHLLYRFTPFLKKPNKIVLEKTKTNILIIVRNLLPLVQPVQVFEETEPRKGLSDQLYQTLSILFLNLRHRSSRLALLGVFDVMAQQQEDLRRVYGIMESLNAFSDKRIEEPNFERRLNAYGLINEQLYSKFTSREWLPLLYNMLFFIQDPDELIIRTNAAFSLKRFVEVLSSREDQGLTALFTRTFFPALKRGLSAKSELVRNEILSVLAFSIQNCDKMDVMNELRPLLAYGDSEADFFNNIYHVQVHRRTRALRRLSDHVISNEIRSATIAEVFVPITDHFIMNASATDHILVDVAISTLGSLSRKLNWGAYNSLVQHYLVLLKDKDSVQRAFVRALVSILEGFHFSLDIDTPAANTSDPTDSSTEVLPTDLGSEGKPFVQKGKKISEAVNTRLLPSLLHHLETRDGSEDALRIPVSVGIAQIALHLPENIRDAQITRLLTVVSQVFRSKSFETRKLARDTLCRIVLLIGPTYLPSVIAELRTALLRGSHLHILATVVHAILDRVTSPDVSTVFGALDACAADIAHVASEVIFGQSGKDVQSEGFTSTVQEVRGSSSKGLESFTILARSVTATLLSTLLSPIKGILHETAASKTMHLVDDVIRRISTGLNANQHVTDIDRLSLCHTLVEQNADFLQATRSRKENKVRKVFAVQTKRRLGNDEDYYSINKYKFVVLGLDLFNVAIRRGRFDLKDPEIISRLETMVPVIGNCLYSQDSPVVIQSLKATMSIVKCPLKAVDESLPIFIKQIMELLKQTSSIESEISQAAFRTLTIIIRDCPSSQIKEQDLIFLIELVTPDLEEPTRQAAIFGLLRAIVSRKIVVVEIYDLMDKVVEMLVTNQAPQVQGMCRNVLLQFLLDYPQGQGRLRKQMSFLAKNLSYPFEMGRLSVMELLAAMLIKFDPALLRDYAEMFFVALVMVLANDDSSKCKETAASLIRLLFDQLDIEQRKTIASRLHKWCSESPSSRLACVSAQVTGLLVENFKKSQVMDISLLLEDMDLMVNRSLAELEKLESNASEESTPMEIDAFWQPPYYALTAIYKCLREYPSWILTGATPSWSVIYSHLIYPHAWVRSIASKLVGLLLNAVSPFNPEVGSSSDSRLTAVDLKQIAKNSCIQLQSDALDATLSLQIIKNLFFIGKCYALVDYLDHSTADEKVAENEDIDRNAKHHPLSWLFSKLSYQVRTSLLARRNRIKDQENWCEQPLAIFHWFAAMSSHLSPLLLCRYLNHILNPVYRVLNDDSVHDDYSMEKLKTLAAELSDLVQNKVGTTKFSEVYNTIQHRVINVRQERKAKAATRFGKDPRGAVRRKIDRNITKKKSRARKVDLLTGKKRRNDNNSFGLKRK